MGKVEKTDPRSADYPTDYSTDYPTDYSTDYLHGLTYIINQITFTGKKNTKSLPAPGCLENSDLEN